VFVRSEDIKTSATIVYMQLGEENYRSLMLLMILTIYIKEPFFDELRTRRQLAYNVQTALRNNRGVLGMLFLLVSSNASPKEAAKLMKEFIFGYFGKFKMLSAEEFVALKKAVFAKLTEPLDSLKKWSAEVCHHTVYRTFQFNRNDPNYVKGIISQITKEEVQLVIEKLLKAVFEVHVVARCHT
jgi:nardilysin